MPVKGLSKTFEATQQGLFDESQGNCWGNTPLERFFSGMKRVWVTAMIYPNREAARTGVYRYINHYNSRRLHMPNGDKTPIEYEHSLNEVYGNN